MQIKVVLDEDDILKYFEQCDEHEAKVKEHREQKLKLFSETWRSLVELHAEMWRLTTLHCLSSRLPVITLLNFEIYKGYNMNYHLLHEIDVDLLDLLTKSHSAIFGFMIGQAPSPVNIP